MKTDILGIKIDNVTNGEALERMVYFIKDRENKHMIFTPNSEICMIAVKDNYLMDILNSASLCVPDGQGVVLASRILKNPIKERVAGCDLMISLLKSEISFSVYLLGGAPGIAEKAAQIIRLNYPNVSVKGFHHGYFKDDENEKIIEEINGSDSDFLMVSFGAPKQEKWIAKNLHRLNINAAAGIGGTIDIISGNASRGPYFYQKYGLEWLYRLIKQPKRLIRMLNIPKFLFLCIKKRFRPGEDRNLGKL